MAVTFNFSDKNILSTPTNKMSKAQKELLEIRLQEAAEAIAGSGLDAEMLAFKILELKGRTSEGSVKRLLDASKEETPAAQPGVKSAFATMRPGRSGQ